MTKDKLAIRYISYFNPRTREGCDFIACLELLCVFKISIHAPVKGATSRFLHKHAPTFRISIHAPVKGATDSRFAVVDGVQHFNPRTREGCDKGQATDAESVHQISIHAPVKGATFASDEA